MNREKTGQMLKTFRKDFELRLAEMALIMKPAIPGFEKRARKMDKIQRVAKEVLPPGSLRDWLLRDNKILGESPFDALVKGHFDKVIKAALDLKNNII